MNTIKKIKNILFVLLGLGLLNSCVQDDEFAIPSTDIACTDAWETNMTLQELVALVDADSDRIVKFEDEKIIEGYVISDDLPGNFFKTISIQDSPTNPTIGVQVEIDAYNLANYYPLGSKIKISLKGIYAGFDRGVYKIGETYDSNGETRVGRMRAEIRADHVKRACDALVEITPVVFESIAAAKTNGKLNTLITIKNVQFQENQLGLPYAPPGETVDRVLEDPNNGTIILRNSGYADFAAQILPEGSGNITTVLSKFNSTFQLYIRDELDVKFDQPRFGEDGGGGDDPGPSANAVPAFAGNDFENYAAFLAGLNNFGIQSYATQSPGTGVDGSNSLKISMASTPNNDYVFTSLTRSGLPATYSKVHFYVKGTSSKSISINLYKTDGSYYAFNLGDVTGNKTVSMSESNQYSGGINTGGNWAIITLDLSSISDLNVTNTSGNFFALKVGSGQPYDLHLDNFTIE